MSMTSAEGCWLWAKVRKWISKLCEDGCPWLRQARLCFREVFNLLSFEFLVRRENGGGVVFIRALVVATLLFALSLFLYSWFDPLRTEFGLDATRTLAAERLEWFGVLWGGAYVALYTRFASQWSYLATTYNQIKNAELSMTDPPKQRKALAAWMVGFIVDAWQLHLIAKDPFPGTIAGWFIDYPELIDEYHRKNNIKKLQKHLLRYNLSANTKTALKEAIDARVKSSDAEGSDAL